MPALDHCKTTVIFSIVRDKVRDLIFGKSLHSPLLNKIVVESLRSSLGWRADMPKLNRFFYLRGEAHRDTFHKIEPDLLGSHHEAI